jgi:hypothetical protein
LHAPSEPLPTPSEQTEKEKETENEKKKEGGESAPAPAKNDHPRTERPSQLSGSLGAGPPAAIVSRHWYERYAHETGKTILPSGKDISLAHELLARLGDNLPHALSAVDGYFTHWRKLWFAKLKDSGLPDFAFPSFCAHVSEVIAFTAVSAIAAQPRSTAAPVSPEELKPPTQEDLAFVEATKRHLAASGAGGKALAEALKRRSEAVTSA